MSSLADIEKLTKNYADHRERLNEVVSDLHQQTEILKRRALPAIKKAVAATAEAESRLRDAILGSPELFVRPKTLVISGVKVGFVKQKGQIEFDDPAKVCALIEKHFPDLEETLVSIKKAPVKSALGQLAAVDLKRLGVRVTEDGETVVVKPVDDHVDKLVAALLKEATADDAVPA